MLGEATADECVVGKNYRLQDIQLSESDETYLDCRERSRSTNLPILLTFRVHS